MVKYLDFHLQYVMRSNQGFQISTQKELSQVQALVRGFVIKPVLVKFMLTVLMDLNSQYTIYHHLEYSWCN